MGETGIGIISDCPLQRHVLQGAIKDHGFEIATNTEPSRLDQTFLTEHGGIQAWVVIIVEEDRWEDPVSDLIDYAESAEAPVLFGLEQSPGKQSREYPQWERRLLGKLEELLGKPEAEGANRNTSLHTVKLVKPDLSSEAEAIQSGAVKRPQLPPQIQPRSAADSVDKVIILAASLGGPAAVKEFLDALPGGLPAAFVYAQHIDQNAAKVLLRVLGRHSALTLHEAKAGETLRNGEIILIPVDNEISFDSEGQIVFHSHPWPGPYGPSINQVMLNVADHYRNQSHAILFSGMGNDGAIASPLLKAYGNPIWSQSSESCVISSMPDAVASTGCVDFRGTPTELAKQLVIKMAAEEQRKPRQIAIKQ